MSVFLEQIALWLPSWIEGRAWYELAAPMAAMVVVLVAVRQRRLRADTVGGCARCAGGYRLDDLEPFAQDGRQVCLHCPKCEAYYAVERTARGVTKVDASWVAANFPPKAA